MERPDDGADERRAEQRRVDAARERNVGLPFQRDEPGIQRGERPVEGDRIVDDDRIERRQLLPRSPNDADRPTSDTVPHDRDRVLDRRQPVPVEQRLGCPIRLDRPPARTTAPTVISELES